MDGTDHATEPAISLLPSPLTLLRLGKSDLDICTKHLLRLAFFNQGYVECVLESAGQRQYSASIVERGGLTLSLSFYLPVLLRPSSSSSFFSYTETEEEASLVRSLRRWRRIELEGKMAQDVEFAPTTLQSMFR